MPLTTEQRLGVRRSIISDNRKPFERDPTYVCYDRLRGRVCDPDQALLVNIFLNDMVDFDPKDFD